MTSDNRSKIDQARQAGRDVWIMRLHPDYIEGRMFLHGRHGDGDGCGLPDIAGYWLGADPDPYSCADTPIEIWFAKN